MMTVDHESFCAAWTLLAATMIVGVLACHRGTVHADENPAPNQASSQRNQDTHPSSSIRSGGSGEASENERQDLDLNTEFEDTGSDSHSADTTRGREGTGSTLEPEYTMEADTTAESSQTAEGDAFPEVVDGKLQPTEIDGPDDIVTPFEPCDSDTDCFRRLRHRYDVTEYRIYCDEGSCVIQNTNPDFYD